MKGFPVKPVQHNRKMQKSKLWKAVTLGLITLYHKEEKTGENT